MNPKIYQKQQQNIHMHNLKSKMEYGKKKIMHRYLQETSVRADVFPASRVCAQVVSEREGLLS